MLEPFFTDGYNSKILTKKGIRYSKMTVRELLEEACLRYASTFEGRMKATRIFMKYYRKTPLIIDPNEIGAVPTMSYEHLDCVWLFNHHFLVDDRKKASR